jgi:hypothetical protein
MELLARDSSPVTKAKARIVGKYSRREKGSGQQKDAPLEPLRGQNRAVGDDGEQPWVPRPSFIKKIAHDFLGLISSIRARSLPA